MQTINIPGFEGQQISAEVSSGFSSSKLFVNGQPAPPAPKKNQYLLQRNDGTQVTAYFKGGFPDPTPSLVVGDQTIRLVEPLAWYEWAWAGFPIVLLFLGGAIGGLCGGAALTINTQIFRSQQNAALKYVLSGLVSCAAFVLYSVLVLFIRSRMTP